MKVAVIGSGPSAAFAVLACREIGIVPDVYSSTAPSTEQLGAFFLHWLPPALELLAAGREETHVTINSIGQPQYYLVKQWGRSGMATSFPETNRTERMFHSTILREVWATQSVIQTANALRDQDIIEIGRKYNFVFHTFPSERSKVSRSVIRFPVLNFRVDSDKGNDEILYNGNMGDRWVRMTRCGGRVSFEFPRDQAELARKQDAAFAMMDVAYLRDIHPETTEVQAAEYLAPNIIPIGRFAQWKRSQLSHQAYQRVLEFLQT